MRKAAFIISLSLISVFITGHYFIYKSVLKAHKKEFKAFIRSNYVKPEQLEINPSQLYTDNLEMQWLDENKEVCVNGVMYDILSIKNAGTKVILNVVKDKDEKELMDRYQKQFNDAYDTGTTGKKNNSLVKDFLALKFFQEPSSTINIYFSDLSYTKLSGRSTCIGHLTIHTPPP